VLFGARPSLGQAQWLLDRARDSGDKAWRCVGYLGNSRTWSTESLWASRQTGPTASGLLSDPNFKLLNFLNASRMPGDKALYSAKLWNEVLRCERIENGFNPNGSAHVDPTHGVVNRDDTFFTD
jgi:hypothetical protein